MGDRWTNTAKVKERRETPDAEMLYLSWAKKNKQGMLWVGAGYLITRQLWSYDIWSHNIWSYIAGSDNWSHFYFSNHNKTSASEQIILC